MVIALFALSLVMIVGGIAAVVQGFPYVRLESGLAMVIGGTTAASAGVILLGLGAVVVQLRRLEDLRGAFHGGREDTRDGASLLDPAFRASAVEAVPPIATIPRSGLAGAAGLAGISLGAAAAPDLTADRSDTLGPGNHGTEPVSEQEPILPDPLRPEAVGQTGSDEDLFARPEDRPGHVSAPSEEPVTDADGRPATAAVVADEAQHELALRPSLGSPAAEAEPPQSLDAAAEAEPAKPERQAVGSYASGGNTYVMYSDGTIDADTPRGRFTFQSLDELKEFVASGEVGERGAA